MDEERKARLKQMVATNAQVGHGEGRKKKSKTGEDGSYYTAQIGLGDSGRKTSKNRLDLIWIEIELLKIQGMIPLTL